jgi:hypothetical protein
MQKCHREFALFFSVVAIKLGFAAMLGIAARTLNHLFFRQFFLGAGQSASVIVLKIAHFAMAIFGYDISAGANGNLARAALDDKND